MKPFLPAGLLFALLLQITAVTVEAQFGGIEDQDLSQRQSQAFQIRWRNSTIYGTIWLPSDDTARTTLAALVHGDGPQDRTSGGSYNPLINVLLDQGIVVASWDKPGVAESEGDSWLDQSMSDRADETRNAIQILREHTDAFAVGAVGFSQAGWVLPRLSVEDGLDFLVLVGPAVNWQDQGEYFATVRMELEGKSPAAIEEALIRDREKDDVIFNASTYPNGTTGLDEDRWAFVKRNRHEDSTRFIQNLTIPTLAVWGEDDLNVDAIQDAATYQELLNGSQHQVVLIPNATHGLQKSIYNYQLSSQWPLHKQEQWYLEGRSAYAEGALELLTDWVLSDHQKAVQSDTNPVDLGSSVALGLTPNRFSRFSIILTGLLLW